MILLQKAKQNKIPQNFNIHRLWEEPCRSADVHSLCLHHIECCHHATSQMASPLHRGRGSTWVGSAPPSLSPHLTRRPSHQPWSEGWCAFPEGPPSPSDVLRWLWTEAPLVANELRDPWSVCPQSSHFMPTGTHSSSWPGSCANTQTPRPALELCEEATVILGMHLCAFILTQWFLPGLGA